MSLKKKKKKKKEKKKKKKKKWTEQCREGASTYSVEYMAEWLWYTINDQYS